MKRKNEEQLIELAFGDLNAAEAERLRHEIASDPKACETLRTYEDLRSSLGGLRNVPEMQMSRERLRDAILAGGLKESRRWNLQWLGAPVAIAAVAFAFTMVARRPSLPLPSGGGMVATQGFEEAEIRGFDATIERISPPTMFGNPDLGTVRFNVQPTRPSEIRVASVQRPKVKVISEETTLGSGAGIAAPELSAPTVLAASALPDATLDTMSVAEDTEVIVLTTETNRDTGAQRATTMESANNVLIGG